MLRFPVSTKVTFHSYKLPVVLNPCYFQYQVCYCSKPQVTSFMDALSVFLTTDLVKFTFQNVTVRSSFNLDTVYTVIFYYRKPIQAE
jgi:hypothetical protein